MKKLQLILLSILISTIGLFAQLPTGATNASFLFNQDITISNNTWHIGDKIITTTILGDICGIGRYDGSNFVPMAIYGYDSTLHDHYPNDGDTLIYSLYDTLANTSRPCLHVTWNDSMYYPSGFWLNINSGDYYMINGIYLPKYMIWDYNPPNNVVEYEHLLNDEYISIRSLSLISDVNIDTLKIYPNPTSGILYIENDEIVDIEIFSMDGKLLHTFYDEYPNTNIDLGNLPAGTYILNIIHAEKITPCKVFIRD